MASVSDDKTVRLWNVATGQEVRTLSGMNEPLKAIAFSPDGRLLASADDVQIVRLWEVTTGREIRQLTDLIGYLQKVTFSPDGKTVVTLTHSYANLWDVATGKQAAALAEISLESAAAVAFSPDGKILTVASHGPPGTADGGRYNFLSFRRWETATGRPVGSFVNQTTDPGNATFLTFSPDRKILATLGTYYFKPSADAEVEKAARVETWDAATGAKFRTLATLPELEAPLAFSPDSSLLAGTGDGKNLKLWDVATGAERLSAAGHAQALTALAFSPDGRLLASGSADGEIKLWDAADGRELRTFRRHTQQVYSLSFSPDGRTLASSVWDKRGSMTVKLWDIASGTALRTLTSMPAVFLPVAFSPDGKTLACGRTYKPAPDDYDYKGEIRLFEVASGKLLRAFGDRTAMSVAFSPDGKTLASGEVSYGIDLWQVDGGRHLDTIQEHAGSVAALAYSPDGRLLANWNMNDNTVKLRDAATGRELRTLTDRLGRVTSIAFSPDGRTLAGATEENFDYGGFYLWDIATGKPKRPPKRIPYIIQAVAYSPDGSLIAVGGRDAKIRLWDAATGDEIATLVAIDEKDWLVVTPDGLFDGSTVAWGHILWRFSRDTQDVLPIEAFFGDFFRPGLLADLISGQRPKAGTNIAQKDRRLLRLEMSPAGDAPAGVRDADRQSARVRLKVTEAPADTGHTTGSGARDLRLFRNGSLVKVWRGDVPLKDGSATLEATVPLVAGENLLTAYAFNRDNVKGTDAELSVRGALLPGRKGTAYVLVVGIDEYANPRFKLKYAVADARAFGAEFRSRQEALGQYERVELISLQDEEATKANILGALDRLTAGARPEDAIVVFYAGHGTAQGERFYLLPHDIGYGGASEAMTARDLGTVDSYGVSDVELRQRFEAMDAGQILLIIDACNSGQALEDEEKRRGPMNAKGLAQLAYEKGMYVMTAAQSYQAALELEQLGHGLLTYALVEEGLKKLSADDDPPDGELAVREWLDFAAQRVPEMQGEKLGKARGEVVGTGGDPRRVAAQRPRVFYRRELGPRTLIVARSAPAR